MGSGNVGETFHHAKACLLHLTGICEYTWMCMHNLFPCRSWRKKCTLKAAIHFCNTANTLGFCGALTEMEWGGQRRQHHIKPDCWWDAPVCVYLACSFMFSRGEILRRRISRFYEMLLRFLICISFPKPAGAYLTKKPTSAQCFSLRSFKQSFN